MWPIVFYGQALIVVCRYSTLSIFTVTWKPIQENVRGEGWLTLGDRPEREVELRPGDLFVGVLVPALEAREAGDPHHEQAVARVELDRRRLRGDRDLDPEPRRHDVDRRLVAGVEAGLDALRDDPLGLLGRELALRDSAVAGKHRRGDTETEERLHDESPLRSKAAYRAPESLTQDSMLSNGIPSVRF